MPDGGQYTGMKILNAEGAEQFGFGRTQDGSVSMGFDTRPGVGDPRNRYWFANWALRAIRSIEWKR